MSLLFRILYATHANGTHHKLALDGLNEINCENAEGWKRQFLKHAELLMEGSKAPDKQFKDFMNHVLHPGDDYWGGAPEKCRNWYEHLVTALREGDTEQAAYCAGVLSHYFTDPVHPFHTAQSEAENNMHRAVEWSINRSYNSLRREALAVRSPVSNPGLPSGDNWLEDFVCASADLSHADYERLIAHYDLRTGVSTPEEGLDPIGRATIGRLMLYAASGFARILERAIAESGAQPKPVSLSVQTVLATLKIPLKWVTRKMDDAADREAVQAMYDELMNTGKVDDTLSEDDRAIRDGYARDVLAPRNRQRSKARRNRQDQANRNRIRKQDRERGSPDRVAARGTHNAARTSRPPLQSDKGPQPATATTANAQTPPLPEKPVPASVTRTSSSTSETPVRASVPPVQGAGLARLDLSSRQRPAEPAPTPASTLSTAEQASDRSATDTADVRSFETAREKQRERNAAQRFHLELDDDVERAPSIGPKTAARLEKAGIYTVRDLIDANPETAAKAIDARHIRANTIGDWQHQATLVLTIPELRGTHAQLLAGAGLTSAAEIAAASSDDVCARVLEFAATSEGQRILRDGPAPDIEKIKLWAENAGQARQVA